MLLNTIINGIYLSQALVHVRKSLPVKLVHLEKFETKSEALKRENAIKRLGRKKKLELVDA